MNPKSHEAASYSIGWIAPLHFERAAARMMLDEEHGRPTDFCRNDADSNSYSWGRIGEHNVVIASLPEYGTSAAAVTAMSMRASLPHVKLGLLVGIGAGITGKTKDEHDIVSVRRMMFLGDVAVSKPSGANGGVLQHDVKKARIVYGQQVYERNGFLDAPPLALRRALSALRAEHEMKTSKMEEYLQVFGRNKLTQKEYGYPRSDKDLLRKAPQSQAPTGDNIAEELDEINNSSNVHYGTIASGDGLVKSARERDDIINGCKMRTMSNRGVLQLLPRPLQKSFWSLWNQQRRSLRMVLAKQQGMISQGRTLLKCKPCS